MGRGRQKTDFSQGSAFLPKGISIRAGRFHNLEPQRRILRFFHEPFLQRELLAAGSPSQSGFALCTEENGIQFISETAFFRESLSVSYGQHSSVCSFCPIPFSYAGGKKQSVFGKRGGEDSFWNGKTSWGLGTSIAEGKRGSVARFSFRLKNRQHLFHLFFRHTKFILYTQPVPAFRNTLVVLSIPPENGKKRRNQYDLCFFSRRL